MDHINIWCIKKLQFKTGFGGEIYHHLGCWDYVFDSDKYHQLQQSEMRIQGYYI